MDRFLDGLRFGHEALLKKLDLSEDSELRALPEVPLEELVMPEESEQILDPEVEVLLEDQNAPQTAAPTGDPTQTPLLTTLRISLFVSFYLAGWLRKFGVCRSRVFKYFC
ncbi:hypothetical protein RHMOL_Rhmol13G0175700 [Rhododendron molle]|uniref:Uncharacterized protein n=1 Tax=Rhododendron molle TaxID=49168 RepID=A0ACC0L8Q8_RHOML|nr:hypothetical protein RHMOL_Rhmol13G0175700 [Rhododendron molle]